MAKEINSLTVFIASPSDLAVERQIAREAIDELNVLITPHTNVTLDAIGWENLYSSTDDYSQQVVNKQVKDYDIFLGLMGLKIGSPTKHFPSGTIEEFEIAHKRFSMDENSVHIMFYFKNCPVKVDDIDVEQLIKVREFKKTVSDTGVFYKEFASSEQLLMMLKVNLSHLIADYKKGLVLCSDSPLPQTSTMVNEQDLEQDFLNAITDSENAFKEVDISITNLTHYITEIATKTNEAATKLEVTQTKMSGATLIAFRNAVVNKNADDLITYTQKTLAELPRLHQRFEKLVECLIVTLSYDMIAEKSPAFLISIIILQHSIAEAIESNISYKQSLLNNPKVTNKYVEATHRAVNCIEQLIEEMKFEIYLLHQFTSNN